MFHSEVFFREFIEDLEIEASCESCGRATLSVLLRGSCQACQKGAPSGSEGGLADY